MISIRALSTVSLLGLLVAVAGCTGETGTAAAAGSPATAQESVAVAAPATNNVAAHGPSRHRGGPDSLLVAALHAPINLTAAQKSTIESALAATKPATPRDATADKSRATALAAAVRAGKVDATSMSMSMPSQTDIAARMAAHKAATASALATLHATLTPEQRTALVASISQRQADHAAKHAGKVAAANGGTMKMAHAGRAHGAMGPMGGMIKDLDLTQAQKDALHAKLEAQKPAAPTDAERAARKAQHETFRAEKLAKLQSFAGDSFDANAFVAAPAGAKQAHGPKVDRFASTLEALTAVLDATQREKLATKIEAGPPARVDNRAKAAQ